VDATVIGKRLRLERGPVTEDGFKGQLPRECVVRRSVRMWGSDDWYLVLLDEPVEYKAMGHREKYRRGLIRTYPYPAKRDPTGPIGGPEPTTADLFLVQKRWGNQARWPSQTLRRSRW
jgi:hypothetical protein